MKIQRRALSGIRAAATDVMQSISEDQQQSPKQAAYNSVFRSMCEKYSVKQPFELDAEGTKKFFSELQLEWAAYKDEHDMVD
jgi:hypothetical protein